MTSPNDGLAVNASGVQALSNALAVALYQATSGTSSPSAVATGGVASASIPPPRDPTSTCLSKLSLAPLPTWTPLQVNRKHK